MVATGEKTNTNNNTNGRTNCEELSGGAVLQRCLPIWPWQPFRKDSLCSYMPIECVKSAECKDARRDDNVRATL